MLRPFCSSFHFPPFSIPASAGTLPFLLPLPWSCFASPDECQVPWAFSPNGWGLRLGSTPETEWSQQRWVILNCVVTILFPPLPFCSQRIAGEVCCAKCLECGLSPLAPPSKQKEKTLCCELCKLGNINPNCGASLLGLGTC